jgi:imidazole glycerol-phosphate synthase subunit HisH
MVEVVIIDYGMGNIHSVYKSLVKVVDKNSKIKISNSINDIKNSSHIIFPGQGAASECMSSIKKHYDVVELKNLISQKPFLGICMGLQVLMSNSDENNGVNCLDVIDGSVLSFKNKIGKTLKIPHMGWNKVQQNKTHPIWSGIPDNSFFYFVHSYYVEPADINDSISMTEYGINFTSSIARDNLTAVQFHPEKSSEPGLSLLRNFISWDGVL